MAPSAPHEQLRRARAERGEDLAALSARTGLRIHHIRAIEAGHFRDLPPGLYGRAAIRSFALAYGLDAEAVLAGCEELLPHVEDPIAALARMRGVTPAHAAATIAPATVTGAAAPAWRPFAAATVDGAVAGALLVGTSGGAALLARVSLRALSPSAIALFGLALLLGAIYYVWLGGLGGTTFGEYAVGPDARQRDPRPLTLPAIARRTVAAATADARAIYGLGFWAGRRLRPADVERSAQPPAPSPSPPPPHGRGEALTWSMSRRGSVPPPPLHPRRG
jgi:helix-turn-helix protein